MKGDKLLFFGFHLLRSVSFCFVLFYFFSFVEDILKQYLKDENCHYHFPFSLINSNVGQGTGKGGWENEKWEQNRDFKGLKLGFVPIFQFPVLVPRACSLF